MYLGWKFDSVPLLSWFSIEFYWWKVPSDGICKTNPVKRIEEPCWMNENIFLGLLLSFNVLKRRRRCQVMNMLLFRFSHLKLSWLFRGETKRTFRNFVRPWHWPLNCCPQRNAFNEFLALFFSLWKNDWKWGDQVPREEEDELLCLRCVSSAELFSYNLGIRSPLILSHSSAPFNELATTVFNSQFPFFGNFQIFPPNSISCRFERSRPLLKFWTELSPGRLLIGCGAINHGMGAHSGGMATCSIIHNCRHRRRRPATMAQQKRKRPPGRNVSLAAEIMARKAEEGDRAIDTHL